MPTVGSTVPRQVGLGSVRRVAKWSVSTMSGNKSFCPKVVSLRCFGQSDSEVTNGGVCLSVWQVEPGERNS